MRRERERAQEIFGIDIDASLKAWVTEMIGEEKAQALLEAKSAQEYPFGDHGPDLTRRERETLTLIACGYSRQQVADVLYISPETVKSRLKVVQRKMRAKNGMQAVIVAILVGELDTQLLQEHLLQAWDLGSAARVPGRPVAA